MDEFCIINYNNYSNLITIGAYVTRYPDLINHKNANMYLKSQGNEIKGLDIFKNTAVSECNG